jgi:hypothetical protein
MNRGRIYIFAMNNETNPSIESAIFPSANQESVRNGVENIANATIDTDSTFENILKNPLSSLPFYSSSTIPIPPVNDFSYYSSTPSTQIFSILIGPMKWFFGLRWYLILVVVIFMAYLFFQIESAIEHRRQNRKTKKEIENMRGLNDKSSKQKKRVSFSDESKSVDIWTWIINARKQIYNGWIVPWVYILFRTFGYR